MALMNRIGSVKRRTLEAIAHDAALRLCEVSKPTARVVTLAPKGMVEIEMGSDAAEVDIVGVYDPDDYKAPRWIGLSRAILEDLKHEIRTRELASQRAGPPSRIAEVALDAPPANGR